MKLLSFGLAAAAIGFVFTGSAPVKAEPAYPWCLRVVVQDYSVDRCEYRTLEACNRERSTEGASSYCIVNPVTYFQEQSGAKPGKTRQN